MTEALNENTNVTRDESVFASLGINGQLFVFQLLNFGLVLLILWFLILRPLVRKMEERRVLINESLDKAKEVETALAMSERRYQERIDEAKVEANAIIEAAHKESEHVADRLKTKARQDIQLLIDQAKRNIQIEQDTALEAVRNNAATMIIVAMEKILEEKITSEKDRKMIEETMKQLYEKKK